MMHWLAIAAAASLQQAAELRDAGDLTGSSDMLGELIATEPSAEAHLELAVTQSWAGDLAGALASYRSALALRPGWTPAVVGEARIMGWLGQRRAAEQQLAPMEEQEALETLIAVQRARRHYGAARESITRLEAQDARAASREQALLDDDHRTRLQLRSGLSSAGSVLGSASLAHEVSGTVTLLASGRLGQPLPSTPLASGTFAAYAGATWASDGWWVTGLVGTESTPRAELQLARKLGACSAFASGSTNPSALDLRASLGARCGSDKLWGQLQGFAAQQELGATHAAVSSAHYGPATLRGGHTWLPWGESSWMAGAQLEVPLGSSFVGLDSSVQTGSISQFRAELTFRTSF